MNQLENDLKMLSKGLDGLLKSLDANINNAFNTMGENEAKAFAEAMKNANVSDKIEQINKMKNDLNID